MYKIYAVGALISEAEFAQSRADFINKLHVALKEEEWAVMHFVMDLTSASEK